MADLERGTGGLTRRDLLKGTLLLGGGLLAASDSLAQIVRGKPKSNEIFHLNLTARPMSFPILPGEATQTWSYEGTYLSGIAAPRAGYLGPILRVKRDAYLTVDFTNLLPEETTVHWHGLDVPAIMDGHPMMAVAPGQKFNFAFRMLNRGGTYWFHPHPHMRTAYQVMMGMAGVLVVEDPAETGLNLPSGSRDRVYVIQDRTFDAQNQWSYNPGGAGGFLGTRIVINGQVEVVEEVGTAVYRLRFLNGSNTRIYKLGWSNGMPMTVIAGDHGLLTAPRQLPYVMLSPGERVEIWADFREVPLGQVVTLQSQTFDPGWTGGPATLPQGYYCHLMDFRVAQALQDTRTLPATLSKIEPYRLEDATNQSNPRVISITRASAQWLLNGAPYGLYDILPNEIVPRGELQVWEFRNDTGMNIMAHPMHLHSAPFQILDRTTLPAFQTYYDTVKLGLVDEGWKDTFLIMPGQRVRILTKFPNFTGRFLYHCHNLEHEDMGMMRNFDIV